MYDFRLQRTDGSPADPPTYRSLVAELASERRDHAFPEEPCGWLGVRDADADHPPVLVVEEVGPKSH